MKCRNRARNAAGFSLVELVVTIIIVAVLAALALPNFNQTQIDATWIHEEVKAAVRYAQREAVAQRRSVFVRLLTPTRLQLCYDAACTVPLTRMASSGPFEVNRPTGPTITASVSPFSFNGLGQPSAGVTLTVAGKPITVVAETGYVR